MKTESGARPQIIKAGTRLGVRPCRRWILKPSRTTRCRSHKNEIRRRGFAVIRGVYPRAQPRSGTRSSAATSTRNDYYEKAGEEARPRQIFQPARCRPPADFRHLLVETADQGSPGRDHGDRQALHEQALACERPGGSEFDPDNDYTYADRTRRRRPGDKTLGLSPHMDSGSFERWTDPAFQKIYAPVFAGRWEDYDPWKAAHRTRTKEYPSPAVCSMFRTFQGWTALTPQGPARRHAAGRADFHRHRLHASARAAGLMCAEDDLCGAEPGRALGMKPEWHPALPRAWSRYR